MRSLTKAIRGINPGYGQYRRVVLLLAAAVILPALCLLWFMSQAAQNERLAVRQRLTTDYKGRLTEVTSHAERKWNERRQTLEEQSTAHPYRRFVSAVGQFGCAGLLVFDGAGRRLYPTLSADAGSSARPFENFADAVEMEIRQEYDRAIERYEQYAWISDNEDRLAAWIGKARSLAKLGRLDEAIVECRRTASSPLAQTGDSRCMALIANARLLLLGWMKDKPAYAQVREQTYRDMLAILYSDNDAGFSLHTDENLFLARRAMEIGRETGLTPEQGDLFRGTDLQRLVDAEERSLRLAQRFPTLDLFADWEVGRLRPIQIDSNDFYGMIQPSRGGMCVALLSSREIARAFADFAGFEDDNVDYCIVDASSRRIAGIEETSREPFAAGSVGPAFPDWEVRLFFKGNEVFERAARERIALYTWTGLFVIGLIVAIGVVAAKSVGKQVRLNKLKNDFMATVTHELKTPLASMRILVDTLLEGSYCNPQQVTEYLQLVSKENERLSRLIDNFLTFSRMERNKQAFQMRNVSPMSIARTAAEAARTKLSRGNCRFEIQIPDELPAIRADHDAMVTVLVNLLDNAYKYSGDEKQIRLNVTSEDGEVRFAVSDNGVGIPRRAFKKIFRRFYQVDRSLSRRAEGCGLGLSIAKFIVDAHLGRITVESKAGQGSTFTVRIPVVPRTSKN
ncbi:MAG TPA: HAMP domain-containing sensor histidine kinase [Sedimentisphaerales bacterium]|jgi:signal transduction histidine kinase|nr:HAMP domain-containing sensor histidine kinase [Sedimentisphaerales bacterium]HNU28782.1 HAMP domain-containing sensor histidine kinase [Sedimentisphaerales bacterium]